MNNTDPLGLKPGDPFDTEDGAAIDALQWVAAQAKSDTQEGVGVVYLLGDRFYAHPPVWKGPKTEKVMLAYPEGATRHGTYHTHPRRAWLGRWEKYFFSTDELNGYVQDQDFINGIVKHWLLTLADGKIIRCRVRTSDDRTSALRWAVDRWIEGKWVYWQ